MKGTDLPFRIQTPSGYRKYLCSGLYLPSVTTVLSATETEKAKSHCKHGRKIIQVDSKLRVHEALLFTLAAKTTYEVYLQMYLKSIKVSGMA